MPSPLAACLVLKDAHARTSSTVVHCLTGKAGGNSDHRLEASPLIPNRLEAIIMPEFSWLRFPPDIFFNRMN